MDRKRSAGFLKLFWIFLVVSAFTIPTTVFAQKVKEGKDTLDDLAYTIAEAWLTSQGSELATLGAEAPLPLVRDFEAFQASTGNRWIIMVDRITGKPSLVEGGVPWIPGTGLNNTLTASDLGVTDAMAASNQIPVDIVAGKAIEFLKTYPDLFGVDPADLTLMEGASGPMLDYLYNINFQWNYHGIPVENAYLGFYLNSGNLVMFGSTYICDTIRYLDPKPSISNETAWQMLWGYLGKPLPGDEEIEPGRLLIQPLSIPAVVSGTQSTMGKGLEYRLIYVLSFRRPGVMGTWEARVDAHTGEIISFKDANAYGKIQGGVYKTDKNPTQTEVVMPFPYADYGATSFSDVSGNFTGTTGTGTMTGRTGSAGNVGAVDIVDSCGTISKVADATGLIDFGSGTGTDCTIPASGGGAGNTHSARTQYWNVAQIKIKAYTYLPGNTWLQGRLTDNVNLNQSCNAYWNGSSVNFFRSSSNCGNTGELPGVSLHEWAHGMDTNDGNGFSPDSGTGEVYGDTSAMLQTHQSCMGGGFWKSYNTGCGAPPSQGTSYHNCTGYGNCCLDCSGVREADYVKHTSPTPATPLVFNNACPTSTCKGPCGKECHCENAPGIQANWDLVVRVFTAAPYNMDLNTAWQYLDRYWYASAPNRTGAFVCGNNTSSAVGNLFNQYRVVDDCDGLLTNGTPHAAGIWTALGTNHQIGNSAAVNTDNNCGCATLSTPVLSGVAGSGQVTLNWAAITGASSYDIYRNETNCTSGFTKVGNTTLVTFTDTPLSDGVTYYFVIQAKGTGSCPPSAMSNCVTLTPVAGGCTAPGAPTLSSATGACTGVNLVWTAGTGTTLAYNVYRFTGACGGAYTKLAGMPVTGLTYSDTTAVAGTSYAYVVRGVCDAGGTTESANSNCLTGTRLAVTAAPTGVTATSTRCTDVQVAWGAVTGATSYNVLRGTTCGTVVSTFTGVNSPYNDTTAVAGTTYNYWVVAVNSCGNSANSACATGVRLAVPAAPTGVTATSTRCTDVQVAWGAVTGATSYNVLRGTTCGTVVSTFTGATSPYNDTTAVVGTTYNYWVVAVNACGTSTNSACATGVRLAVPAAPTGVTATSTRCTDVQVAWSAVTGAASYNVYRGTTCNTVVNTFTNVTSPYNDTTAVAGTSYQYWVVAVNACGNSANSSCAAGTRVAGPAAPTGVAATSNRCADVQVTWTAVTGATSYNVQRGTTCGTVVTTFTGVTSPYNDTTAVAGTTYQYWVVALNGTCAGADSACAAGVRIEVPAAPAAPTFTAVGCTSITVNWTAVSGATSYDVYRQTGASCTGAGKITATPVTGTSYPNSGLNAGTQYSYFIVANNACGASANGSCASSTTLAVPATPAAPTYVSVVCTSLTVNWGGVSGATSYDVWRASGNGACTGATKITATPVVGTSYPDSGLTANSQYSYFITANNACGTSANGSCSAVTTTCLPNIVYSSRGAFTAVDTNGDAAMEAGEKWSVLVTLQNTGLTAAADVQANLSGMALGDGITVCNGPGTFGTIGAGGTASYTFIFLVDPAKWYATYACGSNLTFNVVGKSTTTPGCPCANEMSVFNSTVGVAGANETRTQVTTPLNATSNTVNSNLGPTAFTLTTPVASASLSYTPAYTPGGGTQTLFPTNGTPDDMATLGNWTGTYSANTGATCHDTNFARSGQNGTYYLTQAASISTLGYTNVTVRMDWYVSNANATTQYLDWSTDGTNWTLGAANTTSTTWQCNQSVVLGAGADNKAALWIRFRTVSGGNNRRGGVDYVSITGDGGGGTGTWTANARVSLVDPSSTVTVLKAYGAADGSPYNILPYYTGAGTYQVRLEENNGGLATLTAGSMTVTQSGSCATGTASCSTTNPKEASPVGNPLTAVKAGAGTTVNVTYTPGCGTTDHVVYQGAGPISAALTWTNATCNRGVSGSTSFDPGDPVSGSFFYFVIVGQNATRESSYGQSYNGATYTERPEANNPAWTCNRSQDLGGTCP